MNLIKTWRECEWYAGMIHSKLNFIIIFMILKQFLWILEQNLKDIVFYGRNRIINIFIFSWTTFIGIKSVIVLDSLYTKKFYIKGLPQLVYFRDEKPILYYGKYSWFTIYIYIKLAFIIKILLNFIKWIFLD